ncbi:uncharacterized protein LOC120492233 [Pimephales promelas]|uniref:uncharacterized protein LOC120492233 n=1 Tax=Pimephales promelas TaxID=90988 RepID=UPI001955A395|nr:uncharacterized protein LOC120492233 [Pimephales promelas]
MQTSTATTGPSGRGYDCVKPQQAEPLPQPSRRLPPDPHDLPAIRPLRCEFSGDEASPLETPRDPLLASSNWSKRQSLFSERWRAERPRLVNTAAEREHVATHICQQCGSNPAAVRCCDCRPRPFFCAECDVSMHTRHVLHNRDAMTAGFFQPLPPTTYVVDKALSHCVRLVPVEMPDKICGCSPESLCHAVEQAEDQAESRLTRRLL